MRLNASRTSIRAQRNSVARCSDRGNETTVHAKRPLLLVVSNQNLIPMLSFLKAPNPPYHLPQATPQSQTFPLQLQKERQARTVNKVKWIHGALSSMPCEIVKFMARNLLLIWKLGECILISSEHHLIYASVVYTFSACCTYTIQLN